MWSQLTCNLPSGNFVLIREDSRKLPIPIVSPYPHSFLLFLGKGFVFVELSVTFDLCLGTKIANCDVNTIIR